jgi:hypothetical protein
LENDNLEIVLINNSVEVFSTALFVPPTAEIDLKLLKYNYPLLKDEDGDFRIDKSLERGTDGNIIANKPIVLDDSVFYATSVIHTGESAADLKTFMDGKYDNYYFDSQKQFFDKLINEWENTDMYNYIERGFKNSIIEYFRNNLKSCTFHYDFLDALLKQDMPLEYIYKKSRELTFRKADYIEVNGDGQLFATYDMTYIGETAYIENYREEINAKIDGHTYFARKPINFEDVSDVSVMRSGSEYSDRQPYRIFETVSLEAEEYHHYVNKRLSSSLELVDKRKEQCVVNGNGIWQCFKVENKDNPNESILINSSGYDYARYVGLEEMQLDKLLEPSKKKNRNHER